jgi:hypothetical protein
VATRACGRAATGAVEEAVEVEGVVRNRRLSSSWPCEGTECTCVAVDGMDSRSSVRPMCVYSL